MDVNIKRFSVLLQIFLIAFQSCLIDAADFVQITSPQQGSESLLGTQLIVKAIAENEEGVSAARLWINNQYHSLDNEAPFEFQVDGLPEGTHDLMVRTRDGNGMALDSEVISINVVSASSYTRIVSPINQQNISTNDNFSVLVEGFSPVGLKVARLWLDGRYHSIDTEPPFSFDVNALSVGQHTLMVRAKDQNNQIIDSETITINVAAVDDDIPPDEPTLPDAPIRLPLEVFGPSGTTKSLRFNLDDTSQITHLYLRCNACAYHDINLDKQANLVKASVSINGSDSIPMKHFIEGNRVYGNESIRIVGGEKNYGGLGGGFRTVRLLLPSSGLKIGENIITFAHQNAVPPSIGFRILEFNLIRNGDLEQKVFADSTFAYDDPREWAVPIQTEDSVVQGQRLWRMRDRLYDPWVDLLDGQGNKRGPMNGDIKASCANCHAEDGRDLKYFNFSNDSIIARSMFHGFSQQEGEQIAAYIRSLPIPVVDSARPWNPSYQPGPGLDNRPVYEWAAGAGMDAVLDNDRDMAEFLLPNGASLSAVRELVDRYKTLNFRELPINIPLPEWNQWLPIIHPDDAFDISSAAIRADYNGNAIGMPYYQWLYESAKADPTQRKLGAIAINIKRWLRRELTCSTGGLNSGEPMRALNGAVLGAIELPAPRVTRSNCNQLRNTPAVEPYEIVKRGLSAWASVKLWEIIHSNDLESEGSKLTGLVCSADRCIDASEPRGWVVDGRNVFDRAPHFIGTGGGRKFFTQNPLLGILESNAWYHLNMIINPGYRRTMPSHFAYTYSHVELLQFESGVDQGFRFWATMIKQRQLQTNGRYGVEAGLDLRTAQPYIYYGSARRQTRTVTQASVGQPLWRHFAQAMLEDFVADANQATAQDWANANQNRKVQARNSTNFSPCSGTCTFDLGAFQGRNTYRVIPKLREIGVQNAVIDDLIDWGKKTWPRGPWERLR